MYRTLTIILTDKCNLACSYCYLKEMGETRVISEEKMYESIRWFFKRVLAAGEDEGGFVFFGGEPLLQYCKLQNGILFAKELAKSLHIKTSFTVITNGTLLKEERIEFFKAHGVRVQVSLDGKAETHDQNRKRVKGEGSFDLIGGEEALEKLTHSGVKLANNLVYTAKTVEHLYANFLYFVELGFKNIRLRPVTGVFDNWDEEVVKKQIRLVLEEAEKHSDLTVYPFSSYYEEEERVRSIENRDIDSEVSCQVARNNFTVDMEGGIYPCHRFRYLREHENFRFGFVDGKLDREKLNKFRSAQPRRNGGCVQCPYKYVCDVQCVCAFHEKNNDLNKPDPALCFLSMTLWGTFYEYLEAKGEKPNIIPHKIFPSMTEEFKDTMRIREQHKPVNFNRESECKSTNVPILSLPSI